MVVVVYGPAVVKAQKYSCPGHGCGLDLVNLVLSVILA